MLPSARLLSCADLVRSKFLPPDTSRALAKAPAERPMLVSFDRAIARDSSAPQAILCDRAFAPPALWVKSIILAATHRAVSDSPLSALKARRCAVMASSRKERRECWKGTSTALRSYMSGVSAAARALRRSESLGPNACATVPRRRAENVVRMNVNLMLRMVGE
ncbi:hypothetical protein DFP72DRAFT_892914 [Ephemerocybe angulata]|uniref:Uncharacterized protein n=1 Tax=Ephemerocybe angulata TaxID=980116 RepID=A0A8H6I159_9AGAR|nr:hypothetical protein DFP72DRAFT_892914 [Tulosesus angulatus]